MNKNHIVKFFEDDNDSYEETDSDCSYTPDAALLGGINNSFNDPSARRRSLYRRGFSRDSHSQVDKEIKSEYSLDLRYKKAVEGCEEYFQYWSNRIKSNEVARQKFFEQENQGVEMSILHYAAQHYRQEICEILIDNFKFDPNIKTRKNITPLHAIMKFNSKLKTTNSIQEFTTDSLLNVIPGRSRTDTIKNSEGIIGTIEVFLKKNANVNAQDANGFTPLHYAAMKDNYVAADRLISVADKQKKDDQYMTPMHVACKYGSELVFNLLLRFENPVDLATSLDIKSSLPLHHACSCKVEKLNMVERILETLRLYDENNQTSYLKTALQQRNWRNKTPLHLCIENNHIQLVQLFCMKYEADVNLTGGSFDNYPIHMAAKIGSEEIMEILENFGANLYALNRKEENLLHIAACANQSKFIEKYLEKERSNLGKKSYVPAVRAINMKQQTPLLCAAFHGNTECVDVLIKKGRANIYDKDRNENTIFHLCAIRDNIQIFKYLLQSESCFMTKPDFMPILKQSDKDDNTVVHLACKYGHLDILKFIFSSKFIDFSIIELIFAKNIKEQTGFHIACFEGHYNIVKFFLTMKRFNTSGLIQDVDEDFNTGLHLASVRGHHHIVDLLISHSASIEARNSKDWAALDIASHYGWVKVAEILLQNDALMYVRGCKTNPLLLASINGKKNIVHLLLNNNADITLTNDYKENCLDLALKYGHKEVVETILNNKNWMQVIHKNNNKQYETMINEMPDMMELLLNKIEEKKVQTKKYDFSVLDLDFEHISEHPLMMMAKSRKENLLRHSITQKLIELKWKTFPQYLYLLNLALYFIFVILLSIHVTKSNRSFNSTKSENYSNMIDDSENFKILRQDVIVYIITLGLLVLHIIKELMQLFIDPLAYFERLDNVIELSTYTLTLLFMVPIFGDSSHSNDHFQLSKGKITFHRCEWQWQLGSICILLAWIVFVFFIEKFQIFGKYVMMFHRILVNSLKFFPVFLLFILGFALSFSMLLGNKENDFGQFATSIMKTISMMIGELEFKDIFIEKSWANYVVYTMFVSLMCIIIFNLLVGLAVGDINKVEIDAFVELIIMKIDFILQIQKSLRSKCCFNRNFMQYENETEIDYAKMNVFHKFSKKVLNFIYRAFNKTSSSTTDNQVNEVYSQEALTKTIQELQANMLTNFNAMNTTISKLRSELKFVKTQLKTSHALLLDVKKNVLRQRCISN